MQGIGTVTVMVTDMVGSTELRMAVGEATADRLRQEHDAILTAVVEQTNGSLVKGTGDGIIATFPGAADAVSAAVAMQQAVHGWDTGDVGRQAIRVGLSAGDVTWDDGDCFGTPVIEAARLCAVADGGQILAADVVRVLARSRHGQVLNALGALELKGLSEPVTTYEVSWSPPVADAVDEQLRLPSPLRTDREFPFAGRADELGQLSEQWSAVQAGECRLSLLAGEPGIGKTRLAAEIAQSAYADGATVLYGRCDEDMGLSYQPFVEALQYFVDHRDATYLGGQLGPHAGDLVRLYPDLASIVPALPAPLQSDPEAERYRLFDAVRGWLQAASTVCPMVLILDDVHAAAKPTLMLLRHVLRSTDGCRLLVVATYRDTELGRTGPLAETLAELRPLPGVERLSLTGLDQEDLSILLDQPADSALTTAVYLETEGNPFFTREVFRHLQESGSITKRDDSWVADGPITTLGIPEGVREVIGRRLVRLSPAANDALSLAAVIGSEFTLVVLHEVQADDEDALVSALDEALAARLLIETGVGEYRFAHALVRSTLYDELGLTARVRLHRRVGVALESVRPDDVFALAHHFGLAAAAGESERAARYTLLAAQQAHRALAIDDAKNLSLVALELLEDADNRPLRCDALTALGEAQRHLGEAEYRETLLSAARLAREANDVDRLVAATLANGGGVSDVPGTDDERIELIEAALVAIGSSDSSERARLLALMAYELGAFGGSASERSFGIADEALAMARRLNDEPTMTSVLHLYADAIRVPHTLAARLATTAENVALADALGDPVALGWALQDHGFALGERGDAYAMFDGIERAGVIGREYGVVSLSRAPYIVEASRAIHEGRIADADPLVHEAFRVLSETGHRSAFAFYAGQLIALRRDQGRLDELLPVVTQASAENPTLSAFTAALCLIHAELDQPEKALPLLQSLVEDDCAAIPYDNLWLLTLCNCADISTQLGDSATAAVLLDRLAPFHDQFAYFVTSVGSVAHFIGSLLATLGRFDEADARFAHAAEMETSNGAVTCLARTRLDWARMLLQRAAPDDRARARSLLADVISTAQTVGLPTVERRARELLQ